MAQINADKPIFNHGFHGFHGLNLLAGRRIGQTRNLKGLFNRRLDSPLLALIFAKSLAFLRISNQPRRLSAGFGRNQIFNHRWAQSANSNQNINKLAKTLVKSR
jgi:hypothetical protein